MSHIPTDLRYNKTHEWVRADGGGIYTVGITEYAQQLLGDMVFVDLPIVGSEVSAGYDCAVAESVKAASDIYAPMTGTIIEVNNDLVDAPELVNSEPYDKGWLFKIQVADEQAYEQLLDTNGYQAVLDDE